MHHKNSTSTLVLLLTVCRMWTTTCQNLSWLDNQNAWYLSDHWLSMQIENYILKLNCMSTNSSKAICHNVIMYYLCSKPWFFFQNLTSEPHAIVSLHMMETSSQTVHHESLIWLKQLNINGLQACTHERTLFSGYHSARMVILLSY